MIAFMTGCQRPDEMQTAMRERAAPAPVSVVYQDQQLLVFDKPAGLLSVPGRGADKADCLSARAQALDPQALIVHRIDMATSGLILMARGAAMQRSLSQAFARREVAKRYVAVVAGRPQARPGADGWSVIDLPIAADWPNRPRRVIDQAGGKASLTRWRVLALERDRTRIELEPLTGRTHQLRVHLQALGHPILGDLLYAPPAVAAASPRLLLHACCLKLADPVTGEPLEFLSPVPF